MILCQQIVKLKIRRIKKEIRYMLKRETFNSEFEVLENHIDWAMERRMQGTCRPIGRWNMTK